MVRNTVFQQLLQLLSRNDFKKCVNRHKGDKYTKRFNCWQQIIVLLFAQAKGLDSLRDIELSLRSQNKKWYHLGITSVARSTLSDSNKNRSSDIFQDAFYSLLAKCRELAPKHKFKNPLYSFDSSLFNVCLSLFSWAKYRTKKGAFKLHSLLDHSGYLPSFFLITDGKCHDINVVKDEKYGFPALSPDSIILIDRAYIDFKWLYSLTIQRLFFVTKAKSNMNYEVIGQQDVPQKKGVISDQIIKLSGFYKKKD